jgi:hypothetical protein
MTILELSAVAREFYDGLRAPSLAQGWEKYVVTDGTSCLFVRSDYEPQPGEAVFFLCVRNFNTSIQLYKANL